jgi:hypothetical protein
VGHREMAPPPSRDSSAAGVGADPERESGVGAAWARRRHAVERGHVAQRQPISLSTTSLPYTLACSAKCASGTARGFVGLQPVTNRIC